MNLNLPLQFMRVTKLLCGIFFLPHLCLYQVSESNLFAGETDRSKQLLKTGVAGQPESADGPELTNQEVNTESTSFKFEYEAHVELKNKNIQRANDLLGSLYSETTEDLADTPDDRSDDLLVGAQAGYYIKSGIEEAYVPLVQYGRVWAYDVGMALSLAVTNKDPTSHERIMWLRKHAQNISDPRNSKEFLFAGWPFSKNQVYLGDNWMDCRFITGANACALLGMAEYITSELYQDLDKDEQDDHLAFFAKALEGILYHIESAGPNEDLITAGWTINALKEFYKTNHSYGEILSLAGYGTRSIEGYPYPVKRIRARNIVTEHCANVLTLLNYVLDNYGVLLGHDAVYTYDELATIRLKLCESIFNKLYDHDKGYFITGRSEFGIPSQYITISNASWLCLALRLDELTKNQIEMLSKSLLHTVNSFTKDFVVNGGTYFGAHYFQDGFEDPYVVKVDLHSEALHIEGICGLINGLLKFSDAFPDDPNAPFFHVTALKLWHSLQRFIDNYGFVYASTSLKDINEPLESSVSAIWYLRTCNYFDANPARYDTFK